MTQMSDRAEDVGRSARTYLKDVALLLERSVDLGLLEVVVRPGARELRLPPLRGVELAVMVPSLGSNSTLLTLPSSTASGTGSS